MSGAEMIVQVLADEGVSAIFGYSGGAILPTYDAVFRYNERRHANGQEQIPLYVPANEQGEKQGGRDGAGHADDGRAEHGTERREQERGAGRLVAAVPLAVPQNEAVPREQVGAVPESDHVHVEGHPVVGQQVAALVLRKDFDGSVEGGAVAPLTSDLQAPGGRLRADDLAAPLAKPEPTTGTSEKNAIATSKTTGMTPMKT